MSKLLSIFACIIFSLGAIVASMAQVNKAVVKENGLRDKSVQWIENAIPSN